MTPAAPPPAPPPTPAAFDPLREVERVVQAQPPGFVVHADTPKTLLRIGRDEFKFSVTSERDGFVYVLGLGPDGNLAQLVPNRRSGIVKVKKGQTWRFPTGDRFFLETQEPPGPTQLLVIVSARQRSFDELKTEPAGEIRLFPGREVLSALLAAHRGGSAMLAGQPLCPPGIACDDEYGAALLRFETVR